MARTTCSLAMRAARKPILTNGSIRFTYKIKEQRSGLHRLQAPVGRFGRYYSKH